MDSHGAEILLSCRHRLRVNPRAGDQWSVSPRLTFVTVPATYDAFDARQQPRPGPHGSGPLEASVLVAVVGLEPTTFGL